MANLVIFVVSILLSVHSLTADDPVTRIVTKNLMLSNGLDWGGWGIIEYCEDGSFAKEIEAKFQDYGGLISDETALNALKMYCNTVEGHHTGYITSTIGSQGDWKGIRSCEQGLMTGMRAQVLRPQGTLGDDVAVQNVEMECNYGEDTIKALDDNEDEDDGYTIKPGEWGLWAKCDVGSFICGLEIRYEKSNIVIDTAAVADISMFCCSNETSVEW